MMIPCLNSCRCKLVVLDRWSALIVGCTRPRSWRCPGVLSMRRRTLIARPLDFRYSVHASLLSYHSTTNIHHFCAHLGDMHTSLFPAFQGGVTITCAKKFALVGALVLVLLVSLLQFFVMTWIVNSLTAWWQLTTTMLILCLPYSAPPLSLVHIILLAFNP